MPFSMAVCKMLSWLASTLPACVYSSATAMKFTFPRHRLVVARRNCTAANITWVNAASEATTRAAANTSPEPVSNWILSLAEDGLAVFLAWMAAEHPLITAAVVVVLVIVAVLVIWKLFRYFKVIRDRLRHWRTKPVASSPGAG